MFSKWFSHLPNSDDLFAIEETNVFKTHDNVLLPQRTCIANVTPVIICITKHIANKDPKFHK